MPSRTRPPIEAARLFPVDVTAAAAEIGTGATSVFSRRRKPTGSRFIGCEPFRNRRLSLLHHLARLPAPAMPLPIPGDEGDLSIGCRRLAEQIDLLYPIRDRTVFSASVDSSSTDNGSGGSRA